MNSVRKRRLLFVILLSGSSLLAVFLVICALRQNINFFFTPSQVVAEGTRKGVRIRLGGMVEKGSLTRKEGLQIQFQLTDFMHQMTVIYSGILPDLFREGQGVVALGYLTEDNVFLADEILAKHDENYMPPELVKMVKSKNGL